MLPTNDFFSSKGAGERKSDEPYLYAQSHIHNTHSQF